MMAGITQRLTTFKDLLTADLPGDDEATRTLLDITGRNADIESFGMHARQLVEFLYSDGKNGNAVAGDLFSNKDGWDACRPTMPAALDLIWQRVGGEIAHLNYSRKDTPEEWPYEQIWNDLATVLRIFVDNVPNQYVGPDFRGDVLARLTTKAITPPANARSSPNLSAFRADAGGAGTAIARLPRQGS